jgi:hypothetical protein
VQFSPLTAGNKSESLTFITSSGNAVATLAGTSITSIVLQVTPTSLSFGSLITGNDSTVKYIYVRNTSTAPVTFSNILLGGTNPGDFSFSTYTCSITLQPNTSCELYIYFQPTTAGSRSASTSSVPTAGLAPSSSTFPSQTVGVTGTAQNLTLSNSGTGALTIASIALGGTNPGDFADATTCGSTLAAAAAAVSRSPSSPLWPEAGQLP